MAQDKLNIYCECEIVHQDAVKHIEQNLPAIEESTKLAELFKLFADSTRLRLLQCLSIHELCVCDLAQTLGASKSSISHHLRALKIANLVKFRRQGQTVFYSLADDHVRQILATGQEHILEN